MDATSSPVRVVLDKYRDYLCSFEDFIAIVNQSTTQCERRAYCDAPLGVDAVIHEGSIYELQLTERGDFKCRAGCNARNARQRNRNAALQDAPAPPSIDLVRMVVEADAVLARKPYSG